MAWNKATMEWALEGLGLSLDSSLPAEGVPACTIASPFGPVIVWVRSKSDKAVEGGFMRVMAVCPDCCEVVSVSRLPQHVNSAKCARNAASVARSRAAFDNMIGT
jgi:hypothetical protein